MQPHESWRGGSPHQWPPMHGPYRSDGPLQTPQQYSTYYYAHPSVYGSDLSVYGSNQYSPAAMHPQMPPAAMHPQMPPAAMHPQMPPAAMYPQMPPAAMHHQIRYQQQGVSEDENNRTICVRGLERWVDENYLYNVFGWNGGVISTTVVHSRQTGQPVSEGYGLVEFASRAAAEAVLQQFNVQSMLQSNQSFQLDWAAFGIGDRHPEGSFGSSGASSQGFQSDRDSNDTVVFVRRLYLNVKERHLRRLFSKYGEIVSIQFHSCEICGFVKFVHREHAEEALRVSETVIRGETVHIKRTTDADVNEIYVGGLDENASKDDLRDVFSGCGEIASIRTSSGKGFAFVEFVHRNEAKEALLRLNGTVIRGKAVYLDWSWNGTNKAICVGGLDQKTCEDDLREVFSQYGEIAGMKIVPDGMNASVKFVHRNSAEEAVRTLNGKVIGRKALCLSLGRNPVKQQVNAGPGNQ